MAQPAPAGAAAVGQQVAVGDRQVGVEHDHVGRDPLAVGGAHGPGPAAGDLDPGDLGAVAERHAVLAGGAAASARGTAWMPPRGK